MIVTVEISSSTSNSTVLPRPTHPTMVSAQVDENDFFGCSADTASDYTFPRISPYILPQENIHDNDTLNAGSSYHTPPSTETFTSQRRGTEHRASNVPSQSIDDQMIDSLIEDLMSLRSKLKDSIATAEAQKLEIQLQKSYIQDREEQIEELKTTIDALREQNTDLEYSNLVLTGSWASTVNQLTTSLGELHHVRYESFQRRYRHGPAGEDGDYTSYH